MSDLLRFDPHKLRAVRKGRALTQDQLAERAGSLGVDLDAGLVSAYERGYAEPKLTTLMVLTAALDLTDPRDLFSPASRIVVPTRSRRARVKKNHEAAKAREESQEGRPNTRHERK